MADALRDQLHPPPRMRLGRDYRRRIKRPLRIPASASAAVWLTAAIGINDTSLKLASAIHITSGKFGATDTERGHERVARIKTAGLPVPHSRSFPSAPAKSSITLALRITETGYWVEKHRDIDDRMWKHPKVGSRVNCGACHLDAELGTYEDAAMRPPR